MDVTDALVDKVLALIQIAGESPERSKGEKLRDITGMIADSPEMGGVVIVFARSQGADPGAPGVCEAILDGVLWGAKMALHHQKIKNQESEHGSERKASGVCESGEGSGGDGRA
jgi:hypothetical protein